MNLDKFSDVLGQLKWWMFLIHLLVLFLLRSAYVEHIHSLLMGLILLVIFLTVLTLTATTQRRDIIHEGYQA